MLKKKNQKATSPLFIIKRAVDDSEIREYKAIEEIIIDLENDENISKEKLEKLRTSIESLKKLNSIKIKNSEIM